MGFQRMNRKGIAFKDALFSIIVIGMVVTAVGVIISGWSDNYGASVDLNLNDFNENDEIASETGSQQKRLSPSDPEPGTDAESNTFRGAFGILTSIFEPFRVVFGDNGMLDAVTERFGLPDYIRQGIVTMMILSIIFALIAVIFRLPFRNA